MIKLCIISSAYKHQYQISDEQMKLVPEFHLATTETVKCFARSQGTSEIHVIFHQLTSTIRPIALSTTILAAMDPDVSNEDAAMRQMLGVTSFGKQKRSANVQIQIDQSKRKPTTAPPPRALKPSSIDGSAAEDDEGDDDDDEDEDDDDDMDDEDEFPTSHEIILKTHQKPITSVTLDPSGARLVSSSTDCTFKLHDFASMTPNTLYSFKSVDPTETKQSASSETHPVKQVTFNPLAAGQLLVITAQPQAKIYSRDGEEIAEFVKGDMYIRDLNNTKGHISEITSGTWHPTNRDLCVTAGTDSTLRIWDVNKKREQRNVIVFRSKVAGAAGRSRMTAVTWAHPTAESGSTLLVAAALDGSLLMYNGDGPYHRPVAEIRDAHTRDTWTSSIAASGDGRSIVTRGGDDTVKLWDTRKFKTPVSECNIPSISEQYPTSNVQYSPTSSYIVLGSQTGDLHILNPGTLKPEHIEKVTPNSPLITVLWHEKLNQIITGSANGETHVLYNPSISNGGAKMVMSKERKIRHIDDDPSRTMDLSQGISGDSIVVPGGQAATSFAARHPTIGLTASGRSRDPRRPHLPFVTPFAKGQSDEKYIQSSIPLASMRDEDPREALLKYAAASKEDPMFTKAWQETQPNTIYAEVSDEEEEPSKKKMKR
jgi:WD40 repeat protein